MSANAGTSESKSNSHGQSNTVQNATGTQTPNNLPALQFGWNAAENTLSPTLPTLPSLATAGSDNAYSADLPATNLATQGANVATNLSNGVTNGANQYLTPTARGDYVNSSNPEFANMVTQISNSLQPQIDGGFAAAGRYGSGANANAFGSALTNEVGQLAYNNYNQQQQNQLAAAGQLSANNATGTGQQLQATSLVPSLTSNLFTPGTSETTAAYAPLLAYVNAISQGNPGGTQTSSGNTNTTANEQDWTINHGDSAGFNFGSMMGG